MNVGSVFAGLFSLAIESVDVKKTERALNHCTVFEFVRLLCSVVHRCDRIWNNWCVGSVCLIACFAWI